MGQDAWPIALLGLRIGAVLVLYLFLLSGFRALRAELVAPTLRLAPARATGARPVPPAGDFDDVDDVEPVPLAELEPPDEPEEELEPQSDPSPERRVRRRTVRPQRRSSGRRIPLAVGVPMAAATLAVVIGGGALLAMRDTGGERQGAAAAAPADQPFGPPAVKPAAGRVTVGLAAQEDTLVRVTVDGVVQFDGVLKARQRQGWDGAQRVQVWTEKGKTLLLAVNGDDLGPYSPAMGHPEWNRIDFGFIPGSTR